MAHYSNLNGLSRVFKWGELIRWRLGWHYERQPRTSRTGVSVPFVHNDGLALQQGAPSLTWIGHASFLLRLGGLNILIDPVMSKSLGGNIRRNVAPGLSWDALPPIDIVLITHNHRDHMDAPTLRRLGPKPLYIVPEGLGSWFSRAGFPQVKEMVWWECVSERGVNINFVPAEHWSRRGLNDANQSWWGGFVIEHQGYQVYHAGDTAWFHGFQEIAHRFGRLDLALLPIGAYAPRWFMQNQHMNPEDALRAFIVLNAKQFVAMHWGTFKLTDEPLQEPPVRLRELWKKTKFAADRLFIPAIGETLMLQNDKSLKKD
jgi:L-ascorbate metabolism protein UlaG (beta-lactamase superfamily)